MKQWATRCRGIRPENDPARGYGRRRVPAGGKAILGTVGGNGGRGVPLPSEKARTYAPSPQLWGRTADRRQVSNSKTRQGLRQSWGDWHSFEPLLRAFVDALPPGSTEPPVALSQPA